MTIDQPPPSGDEAPNPDPIVLVTVSSTGIDFAPRRMWIESMLYGRFLRLDVMVLTDGPGAEVVAREARTRRITCWSYLRTGDIVEARAAAPARRWTGEKPPGDNEGDPAWLRARDDAALAHCYRKAQRGRRVIVEGFAFPGEESYLLERAERAAEHAEVRGRFTVTRNDLAWYPGEARPGIRRGR